MSKKNYKKTALERQQHDTAVKVRKMTNYEKIKQMSVEEMALLLMCPAEYDLSFKDCEGEYNKNCNGCVKEWLEQEVEEWN